MTSPTFVHLRVHSAYSLSEGAIKLGELVKACVGNKMPAVAVSDTGNLFGAMEFSKTASSSGVQPIPAALVPFEPPAQATPRPGLRPPAEPLLLIAKDEAGWKNLVKLSSRSWFSKWCEETGLPALPWTALEEEGATEGILCLTGGLEGPLARRLADGQRPAAEALLDRLQALFPDRLYIELQRHGLAAEAAIEPALIDLAYARNIPLVATNDCYFNGAKKHLAHDALLCIAEGRYITEDDRRRVTVEHRFKSADEMRSVFADLPEACDNTAVIAQRCSYFPKEVKPILPPYPTDGMTEVEALRAMAKAGLEKRLSAMEEMPEPAETYRARLDFELDVIIQMGFPGYFLIVADFIQWAKSNGIPVGPGRGSGAGSVVAWALTITDLDPLRFGLLFERFLNPERISMPDFDIDFCQDRRDEVIDYVRQKYGIDRVAQIITFGKLQARAVVRDVGRVLQMPYGQVDRISKMIPNNPANPISLAEALKMEPLLEDARRSDETVERLIEIALELEGLYRHASTHAAGVVIGDRPLEQLVPLTRDAKSGLGVTQYNMKDVETAGLVKFDFLGLKTLTVIRECLRLIGKNGKPVPDIDHIPLDDEKTYVMLSRADTVAVFQVESGGMRDTLRSLKPNRFEDIIALVAMYRPGPMDNIPKYINVKNGTEEPDYLHPRLETILKETNGIMVYQEQVMQIAQVLAGYSLGQADLLRRAMGKKIREVMEKERAGFVSGAQAQGVDPAQAGMIFDQVEKFAGYGFNKSHAAAYALITYQTGWLKANFPVEFLAGTMTLDLSNTDKLALLKRECERQGIKLLPPDVNASEDVFSVETHDGAEAIRYALAAVKGVGQAAMQALIAERKANGPFKSLFDLAGRIDPKLLNKRMLENLARAGAFDRMESNRRMVYEAIETLMKFAVAEAEAKTSSQNSLFGGPGAALPRPVLQSVQHWDALERLRHEFEAIGFYLSAHPLDTYGKVLGKMGVARQSELKARLASGRGSTRYKLAGVVLGKNIKTSAKGNRFAFVQLSDSSGAYEVTVFSEVLAAQRELLEPGRLVLISVDAEPKDEDVRLTCQGAEPLEPAAAQATTGLSITLTAAAAVPSLKALLDRDRDPRGRTKFEVVVMLPDACQAIIQLPGAYSLSPGMKTELERLPGVAGVSDG